ncbi:hypothetical protein NC652_010065 [Populus alba x Populus x berolinensis]|nr:hypothetical protein NC652_010065 [Populus alba x Populus x berolinensis]
MSAIPVAMDKGRSRSALRSDCFMIVSLSQQRRQRSCDPSRSEWWLLVKTKPVSLIKTSIRDWFFGGVTVCFGVKTHAQEFIEKAPQLPEDIEWHFIGNLTRIANHLDRAVGNLGRKPLKSL